MSKHLVYEWCDKYGIEIVDWGGYDFNEDSIVDFNEFIYKVSQCTYYVIDGKAYNKLLKRMETY